MSAPAHGALATRTERRVVVGGGGGVAGLGAARVVAQAGHRVMLFEASDRLACRVLLTARAGGRRDGRGTVDWLATEAVAPGVEVRLDAYAGAGDVQASAPELTTLATGGLPAHGRCPPSSRFGRPGSSSSRRPPRGARR